MDCSKTEVFLREWQRMCLSKKPDKSCHLMRTGVVISCEKCAVDVFTNCEEAIKAVQEWSDAHPSDMRLDVLKEQYPNMRLDDEGLPVDICAGVLYGFKCEDYEDGDDCRKCWNKPV